MSKINEDGEIIEPLSASAKKVVYNSTKGFSPNERVRTTANIPRGYLDYKQVYEYSPSQRTGYLKVKFG